MSVQGEIDRITQSIANAYAVLLALGAELPEEQNSANLATTAGTAKALLYSAQELSEEQKEQARLNIGATAQSLTNFSMFTKWGIVGDSYACGHIVLDDVADRYPQVSWGKILARKCGNTCTLFAYSGLTTKSWLTDSNGLPLLKLTPQQDLYVLALGINDANVGLDYLGTIDDISTYADSFYGNYAKIINEIQTYAPDAKLIMATIASQEKNYPTFSQAIVAIAEHYGIPCIVQGDDPYFQSEFYLDNKIGGHPNAISYAGMATVFGRMIEKAIVENSTYFADYVGNNLVQMRAQFDPTVYNLPVLWLTGDTAPIALSKDNKVTLSYVYPCFPDVSGRH